MSWSFPRRRDAHALGRESEGCPETARALVRARERGHGPASGRVRTNVQQHRQPRVPVSHRLRRHERLERPQPGVNAQTDRPPRGPAVGAPMPRASAPRGSHVPKASAALSPYRELPTSFRMPEEEPLWVQTPLPKGGPPARGWGGVIPGPPAPTPSVSLTHPCAPSGCPPVCWPQPSESPGKCQKDSNCLQGCQPPAPSAAALARPTQGSYEP